MNSSRTKDPYININILTIFKRKCRHMMYQHGSGNFRAEFPRQGANKPKS